MELCAGVLIHEKYRIIEELGAGGFGTVYLATDELVGRLVALKVPAADLVRDRTLREVLLAEARKLGALDDSHIVRLWAVEEARDGQPLCLAMEYLAGGSLGRALLRREASGGSRHLDVSTVVRMLDGVARALDELHARRLIHRDIKPDNLLLDGPLEEPGTIVKLADFGIAAFAQTAMTAQSTQKVVGSPPYMSPEQVRGRTLTGKSDLFSFAATVYELLAGRLAFPGPGLVCLEQIKSCDPEPIEHVSAEVDAAVRGVLVPDPEKRPAGATAFLARLVVAAKTGEAAASVRARSTASRAIDAERGGAAPAFLRDAAIPGTAARAAETVEQVVPAEREARSTRWGFVVLMITTAGVLAGSTLFWLPQGQRTITAGPSPASPTAAVEGAAPVTAPEATPSPLEVTRPPAQERDVADMVEIPAGTFRMGSEDGESDEKPVHTVGLDAFLLDRHEVTNRRWRAFRAATGHGAAEYESDGRFNAPEQPVVGVSWDDAVAFCNWAGKRLPTEAEWEYAARGGLEGQTYPWGNAEPSERASYDQSWATGRPSTVGRYAANGFGLHDMAGNAWERCADWYGEGYYASRPARNPRGPSTGSARVLRGGSWGDGSSYLRCAIRIGRAPVNRYYGVGFRCARSLR